MAGWRKAEDVHVGDIVRCRTGEPEVIPIKYIHKSQLGKILKDGTYVRTLQELLDGRLAN